MPKQDFWNTKIEFSVPRYGASALIFANVLFLLNKDSPYFPDHLALMIFAFALPFSIVVAVIKPLERRKVVNLLNIAHILVWAGISIGMAFMFLTVSLVVMIFFLSAFFIVLILLSYVAFNKKVQRN